MNSSVIEANESGQVISYEEYYPYGRSAYRAAASGVDLSLKRYRFTGKERDEETGLDYFGVRYYAPWLGRWTSGDPGGFVDGLNLYRYVRNNPVNGIDREGYSTEEVEKEKPKPPPVEPAEKGTVRSNSPESSNYESPTPNQYRVLAAIYSYRADLYSKKARDYHEPDEEYNRDYDYELGVLSYLERIVKKNPQSADKIAMYYVNAIETNFHRARGYTAQAIASYELLGKQSQKRNEGTMYYGDVERNFAISPTVDITEFVMAVFPEDRNLAALKYDIALSDFPKPETNSEVEKRVHRRGRKKLPGIIMIADVKSTTNKYSTRKYVTKAAGELYNIASYHEAIPVRTHKYTFEKIVPVVVLDAEMWRETVDEYNTPKTNLPKSVIRDNEKLEDAMSKLASKKGGVYTIPDLNKNGGIFLYNLIDYMQ